MAVPFYMPEEDDQSTGQNQQQNQNQRSSSSTSSSTQQSPNPTGEDLVQAFCQALFRYGGSPRYPPSPSCSPHMTGHGEVFFPRTNGTPRSPRTPSGRNSFEIPRRIRLSSISDDDDDNCYEISNDYDYYSSAHDFDEHFNSMAAREGLQMFPGRVPPRKKKRKEQPTYVWPTVVTAVVLVVGYGLMAIRN